MGLKGKISFLSHWDSSTLDALRSLLDSSFLTEQYVENFPHVFKRGPSDQWIGLCVDGRLNAFCTLYQVNWLHLKHGMIRANCIGSVCVDPCARGQGLTKILLDEAKKRSTSDYVDFIFLFSEKTAFYEKFGFEAAGSENFYHFDPSNLKDNSNEQSLSIHGRRLKDVGFHKHREFEFCNNISSFSFLKKAELWMHLCRYGSFADTLLNFSEFLKMAQIPDMDLAICRKGGQITGSFFMGKGVDFKGIIHGVAIKDSADLLWMLVQLRQQFPDGFFSVCAGPWTKIFEKDFEATKTYSVLSLGLHCCEIPMEHIKKMMKKNEIYVRSLHSS